VVLQVVGVCEKELEGYRDIGRERMSVLLCVKKCVSVYEVVLQVGGV